MIEIAIPGRGDYTLQHLVLDLNGTIALDGRILDGVEKKIERLKGLLSVSIITADTHGTAAQLERALGITVHRIRTGGEDAQKLALVQRLGRDVTMAMGNGANDAPMLRESAIGVCVLGREGAAAEAVASADLVVPDINAALELLLNTRRLIATLRK